MTSTGDAVFFSFADVELSYQSDGGNGSDQWRLLATSLALRPGSAYSLVGENMSGKSTLVRLLTGTIDPQAISHAAGQVLTDLRALRLPISATSMRDTGVVAVHQNDPLFPDLSIWDNVRLGAASARNVAVEQARVRKLVTEVLASIGLQADALHRPLGRLSGGGRALIRILRAAAWGFRVLFLDEPTTNLDAKNSVRCFELLERVWLTSNAVVLISHYAADHSSLQRLARTRGAQYELLEMRNGVLTRRVDQ